MIYIYTLIQGNVESTKLNSWADRLNCRTDLKYCVKRLIRIGQSTIGRSVYTFADQLSSAQPSSASWDASGSSIAMGIGEREAQGARTQFLPRNALKCICAVLGSHVVRLSVCPSVTLVICDHIGWKSRKLIARTISPTPSLLAAERRSTYSQGNMEKFGGDLRWGIGKKWRAGEQKRQYLWNA